MENDDKDRYFSVIALSDPAGICRSWMDPLRTHSSPLNSFHDHLAAISPVLVGGKIRNVLQCVDDDFDVGEAAILPISGLFQDIPTSLGRASTRPPTARNLILAFGIIISCVVQGLTGDLTNYHASIVLSLSSISNTNVFVYFPVYILRRGANMVKVLLDRGLMPHLEVGTHGHSEKLHITVTPLFLDGVLSPACEDNRGGDGEVVQLLLEHGADPRIKDVIIDPKGGTRVEWWPLHRCLPYNIGCTKYLLEKRADVNAVLFQAPLSTA